MKLMGTISVVFALVLSSSAIVRGESFMTPEELMSTLVGKSLSGITTKGIPFTQTILAGKPGKKKGRIEGMQEGHSYESTWKIKGNRWCEAWPGGSDCWRLVKIDDNTVQAYRKKKKLDHVWTLKPVSN